MKKEMNKLLLKIKEIFRWFGIDIAFVKKATNIIPLQHNTESEMDKFWANPKNEVHWKNLRLMRFYKKIVELVVSKGIDLNGKEVLDAGCGIGSLLISINEHFKPRVNFGYEFSKKAIEIAKNRFPIANYDYKNLNDLPDKTFDFIFCTEVLEHIINPHVPFINLLKMLHEKAGLLVTVPNGRIDTYDGHINFWSPESWQAFIELHVDNRKFETGELTGYGLYAIIWN